ncbi:MAG: hypothetical protein FWH59_02835 [Lentimicrobiaceae bacterium]|nr:hypothetical protein [Lentimicrobiaceae bacterium]
MKKQFLANSLQKIKIFLGIIIFLCCVQMVNAQPTYFCGVLWVVPNDPSVLPIDNTITGNEQLNQIFKDFHVASYRLLDPPHVMECNANGSGDVYEILLEDEYSYLDRRLREALTPFVPEFFKSRCHPCKDGIGNLAFFITAEDRSFDACSPDRSCNDALNVVLERYNVLSYVVEYGVLHGDTVMLMVNIMSPNLRTAS